MLKLLISNNNNIQHAAQVEYRLRNMNSGPSFASQQLGLYKPNPMTKTENRVNRTKSTVDEQDAIDSFTQDAHTSSETDIKHSKQQFAQHSRVRKLQYIAELERNVQALQAEGCEVSGELKFLNQKSVILTMENKALKQRLENLAQKQLIKYLEQEVLEKEIGRLRALYKQQQRPPTNQPLVSRGSTNMEFQFANLSLKNKGPGAAGSRIIKQIYLYLSFVDSNINPRTISNEMHGITGAIKVSIDMQAGSSSTQTSKESLIFLRELIRERRHV